MTIRDYFKNKVVLLFISSAAITAGLFVVNSTTEDTTVALASSMTIVEALEGLATDCPKPIRDRQTLVIVDYIGFDGKLYRGQLVVDRDLISDVAKVFEVARETQFPIYSIIPISDVKFRKNGQWDDELSMRANNTSAFNYRAITGGNKLSMHALGRAIDINPVQNPYIKGSVVEPKGAVYDLNAEGTLTDDHPVVKAFINLGWEWGGHWTSLKDYQHFEKPLDP